MHEGGLPLTARIFNKSRDATRRETGHIHLVIDSGFHGHLAVLPTVEICLPQSRLHPLRKTVIAFLFDC
jgi:hypothetical protein